MTWRCINKITYIFKIIFNAAHKKLTNKLWDVLIKLHNKVVGITNQLLKLKSKTKSKVTIGYQMVLMPEYADQCLPLASMSRDLGLDYLVVKHCSDDLNGRFSRSSNYSWYSSAEAEKLLKMADNFQRKNYSCHKMVNNSSKRDNLL